MMDQEPIIALERVSKSFGHGEKTVRAAHDISFALHPGRTVALVGESGSGKTTCARLVMREYEPDGGRILFHGRDLNDSEAVGLKEYRRAVQMIFQDPFASLNPAHTVDFILRRPLALGQPHLKGRAADDAIADLLRRVELDPGTVTRKHPHELSGGQRQRINIARTLAMGARVIVADEPTSMLDVSVRLGVLNLLNEMKRELGVALLYITHDLATARYVAEDILVMYAGQIVEWGDVHRVLTHPQHPYTRLLLSAVPDPEVRFDDPDARLNPRAVEAIRREARNLQDRVVEVGPNHFTRQAA
ncbi:ATP-binding cassette domain-containing protein [Microvirga terrae]|uniref:ATP-binding cassette domain-containing protein n=1 Tax=Microvirga terrae TaxID=2740529 RepID=A0ABY5RXJ7_9HYPH|nr:ATP-binding cassette domain-containing protein [Microvirga terrae]UVF21659.1 ATP-binding cassette domain-containing protein [Microvirga terrae]